MVFLYYTNDDGLIFEEMDNGLCLLRYEGHSRKLEIPSEIRGQKVTQIMALAAPKKEIDEVVIPDSISIIGNHSLSENKLTHVTIPGSVKRIGNNAFLGNQLQFVDLQEGVEIIESGAFAKNCLQNVEIPNSVIKINKWSFLDNNIEKVNISSNVQKIGIGAFANNEHLIEVSLGQNIEIDNTAFGKETETLILDYDSNNRNVAIYHWNETNQRWENRIKELLQKNKEISLGKLGKKEINLKL